MKNPYIFKAILMAFLLTLGIPLQAESVVVDNLEYDVDAAQKTAVLTGVSDKSVTSLVIPSIFVDRGITYTVIKVSGSALADCSSLTTLTIPSAVEKVETDFGGCKALKELTFQDGKKSLELSKISSDAKIEKLYLGRDLKYQTGEITGYGRNRHWEEYPSKTVSPLCNLKSILSSLTIGEDVDTLGYGLFYGFTNLTVVSLPKVKLISKMAFADCQRLTTLSLGDALEVVDTLAFQSCSNLTNLAFPSTIRKIGNFAFSECDAITSVSFPSECVLDTISVGAFDGCSSLTAFKCPPSVSYVGGWAFKDCKKLVTVILGTRMSFIGDSTFENDVALSDMTVPEGVTAIWDRAFYGCTGIASYSLPSTLKTIGEEVFVNNSGLPRLTIPGSVTLIDKSCFLGCSRLSMLTFEDGKENIRIRSARTKQDNYSKKNSFNYDEFVDCPLTRLYLGRNLYGTNFYGKDRLKRVTFGKDVTYLNDSLFWGCRAITKLDFPDSLRIVKNYVFYDCTKLESLSFPGSVDSIGYRCFWYCDSLKSVRFENGYTTLIENGYFQKCPNLQQVYIGRNLAYNASYLYCFNWDTRKDEKAETDSSPFQYVHTINDVTFSQDGHVTFINNYLLDGCSAVVGLALPKTLTWIGYNSFSNMTHLLDILVYDSVKTIGRSCFENDVNLATAKLSESLTRLSDRIFYNCSSLDNFIIPDKVDIIGVSSFEKCASLSKIRTHVDIIGNTAFKDCTAMLDANIYANTIYGKAFLNCNNMITTYLDAIRVNDSVFVDCSSMKKLYISERATNIGNDVFTNCASLRDVTFADGKSDLTIGHQVVVRSNRYETYKTEQGLFRNDPIEKLYLGRNLIYEDDIKYSPFAYDTALDTLTLGTVLTNIGKYAFIGCKILPKVFMPDNILSVGRQAFMDCYALNDLTFSNNLVSVGEQSFENDNSLQKVVLPASLDALSEETFANCTALYDVDLGNTLNTIGPRAFMGCSSLEAISIPKSVYGFGVESFKGSGLRYIKLTEGIKSIGKNAFEGCKNLEGVEFSENLVSIGDASFKNCTKLMTIRSWAEIPPEGLANFADTVTRNALVYVPEMSIEDYEDSPTWEVFFKDHFRAISSDILVNRITLSESVLSLKKGETSALKAYASPVFANNTAVTWTSDNDAIASVSESGLITAVTYGEANITATAADGSGVKATCRVTVLSLPLGDSNCDYQVDVADVTNINKYLLLDTPRNFDEEASDANKDGHISVSDIPATIDIIMAQASPSPQVSSAKKSLGMTNTLEGLVYSPASDNRLVLTLDNADMYNALQADVVLPEATGDVSVRLDNSLSATHKLVTNRNGNVLRVVVYSLSNKPLVTGKAVLNIGLPKTIDNHNVVVTNVKAADMDAESHVLGARLGDVTTSIDGISTGSKELSVSNGSLNIRGYEGSALTITTIGGAVCKNGVVRGNDITVNLPVGIYLVTLDGNTYKFIIK